MGILDILFPKRCTGCQKIGTYFCPSCILSSKLHFPQVCPVCERTSLDGVTHKNCHGRYLPDGLMALWDYKGASRKLIQLLKYKHASSVSITIASAVAGILKNIRRNTPEGVRWEDKFIIVPVPLHWQRQNLRGFNQSEEVANKLALLMGWRVLPLLKKAKSTSSQVGLKEDERQRNIKDVFQIRGGIKISKKDPVLVFDDVWTTGSTMKEAVRVLKKAGFSKVWCLALAR